jgi:hypothetical protein
MRPMRMLPITVLLVGLLVACEGPQGPRGEQGPPGEHGERGETGMPGEMGLQGERGLLGSQGLPGEPGSASGRFLVIDTIAPAPAALPSSPDAITVVAMDGSDGSGGTAGPYTVETSGNPLRVHLHGSIRMGANSDDGDRGMVEVFTVIDGVREEEPCAHVELRTVNANIWDTRTIVCDGFVSLEDGEHTIGFDLGYQGIGPGWGWRRTSLVFVEEIGVGRVP